MIKRQIILVLLAFMFLNAFPQGITDYAKTPPMGWNSWDCFGMDVTEDQMKATADYMAENLKSFGWEYIVLDMGWFYDEGVNTSNFQMKNPMQLIDEYGRVIPNPRKFPSAADGKGLKPLADYVHSKGLKFGLHIVRGIPNQAVERNTPVIGTGYKAMDIASDENLCRWYHGMKTVDMDKPGAQEYYNSLIKMFADWGVDFIKADNMLNNPYHAKEIEAISKAIKASGRPIVLSLSAGPLPVEEIDHLRRNANMWRISNDMWDHWSFMMETFELCREWQNYILPGHWPDCDMLPIGKLRINGSNVVFTSRIKDDPSSTINEFSRFSADEKYSLMGLWSVFRSPLMIGGSLLELDEPTTELLTNTEVLAINQNSSNNKEMRSTADEIVWVADDPISGAKYVALFNINDTEKRIMNITWEELGISGKQNVRDLWKKNDIGKFKKSFGVSVNPHGCELVKIGGK
jgi:hypothetical protein